eukprot:gene4545-4770_t
MPEAAVVVGKTTEDLRALVDKQKRAVFDVVQQKCSTARPTHEVAEVNNVPETCTQLLETFMSKRIISKSLIYQVQATDVDSVSFEQSKPGSGKALWWLWGGNPSAMRDKGFYLARDSKLFPLVYQKGDATGTRARGGAKTLSLPLTPDFEDRCKEYIEWFVGLVQLRDEGKPMPVCTLADGTEDPEGALEPEPQVEWTAADFHASISRHEAKKAEHWQRDSEDEAGSTDESDSDVDVDGEGEQRDPTKPPQRKAAKKAKATAGANAHTLILRVSSNEERSIQRMLGCRDNCEYWDAEKKEYVIVQDNALEDERTSCKYLPFVPHARGVDQIGRPDRNGGAIIKHEPYLGGDAVRGCGHTGSSLGMPQQHLCGVQGASLCRVGSTLYEHMLPSVAHQQAMSASAGVNGDSLNAEHKGG